MAEEENGLEATLVVMRTLLGLAPVLLLLVGCSSTALPEPAPEPEVVVEPETEESVETEYDPCEQGKLGNLWVLAEEDGCVEPWPLTSTSGILMCDPFSEGLGAVVWNPDEDPLEYYAVNGMASTQGYPEIDQFWKDDPTGIAPKVNIGALLDAGLSLCEG